MENKEEPGSLSYEDIKNLAKDLKPLDLKPTEVGQTSINGYKVVVIDIKKSSPIPPFWPLYSVKFNPQGRSFVLNIAIQPIAWLEVDREKLLTWCAESVWDAYLNTTKKELHKKIDQMAEKHFAPLTQRMLVTALWLNVREAALLMKLQNLTKPRIDPYRFYPVS